MTDLPLAKPDTTSPASYYLKARTGIEPLLPATVTRVLELGCGGGATMGWLKSIRTIEHATAIELSPVAADAARATFDTVMLGDVTVRIGDLAGQRFDLILALDVLEHLVDPDTTIRSLRELLTPDGMLIFSVPNIAHYQASLRLACSGRWDYEDEGLLDRTHLRFFTRITACSLAERNGYRIDRLERLQVYPNIFHVLGLTDRKWRWYSQRMLRHVLRWPSHLFDYQFLIAARPAARSVP